MIVPAEEVHFFVFLEGADAEGNELSFFPLEKNPAVLGDLIP